MANFEVKEKIVGVYIPTAEKVSFNKVWGDHSFDETEAQQLLNGDTISFESVSKNGKSYVAKGKLEKQFFNCHEFWGFKLQQDSVPSEFASHTFTDEEINTLSSGGSVYLQDCISKKGQSFACTISWGVDESGRKKLIPSFGKTNA